LDNIGITGGINNMTYEEIFVKNFIMKEYQKRLLYELLSSKEDKRNKAFYKLSHMYQELLNIKYIDDDISHLEDSEVIKIIKKKIKEEKGYSIVFKEVKPIEEAYFSGVNSGMVDVIVINENIAIYIGEIYANNDGKTASPKYILKKNNNR